MTLAEVNSYFGTWYDSPPVYLSLQGIVEGLSGGLKPRREMPQATDGQPTIDAIRREIGHKVPILRGKDPGLPKKAPTFDFDELRQRNSVVAIRRIKRHG